MDLRKNKNYNTFSSNPYVTADRLNILTATAATNDASNTVSI